MADSKIELMRKLADAVDAAWFLRGDSIRAAGELTKAKAEVARLLKEAGLATASGAHGVADLVETETLRVSVAKLAGVLEPEQIESCLRVDIEAARKALGDEALRKIATAKAGKRLDLRPLKAE
ncbi:MAG: hypothetical protein WC789_13765 [Lentisphaeria bacterium]